MSCDRGTVNYELRDQNMEIFRALFGSLASSANFQEM